jgi:hypothetical protein
MHYYLIYTNIQGNFNIKSSRHYCNVGPYKSRYAARLWFKKHASGINDAKFCRIISLPALDGLILYEGE